MNSFTIQAKSHIRTRQNLCVSIFLCFYVAQKFQMQKTVFRLFLFFISLFCILFRILL